MKVESIREEKARSTSGAFLLFSILCSALLVYYFRHSISSLLNVWETPEYSYGYFIVPLSVMLASHKLAEDRPVLRSSWIGIPVILFGLVFQAGIELTGRLSMPPYSILITIVGFSLALFGKDFTKTIKWSLFHLIFCIPLPGFAFQYLSTKLQMLSSTIGVDLLYQINIPAFQEGNVIDLGQFKLQVVEACSGLRYLFPLTSFSFLLAYTMRAGRVKRGVIFMSSVPIAVFMNSLRIAVIGVTVDIWGPKMAEGVLHDFEGWTVFLLCVGILVAEVKLLNLVGKGPGGFDTDLLRIPREPLWRGAMSSIAVQSGPLLAVAVVGIFCLAMAGGLFSPKPEVLPPHRALADFPRDLDGWLGRDGRLTDQVLQVLKPTDYLLADYTMGGDDTNLYVAFYDSQRAAAPHSPEICIPAGGWDMVSLTLHELDVPGQPGAMVKRVVIKRGEDRQIVYFWLVERGRVVNNDLVARWYLFADPILYGRTDGALIRALTPLKRGEDEAAGDARLAGFLQLALPRLGQFIPLQRIDG